MSDLELSGNPSDEESAAIAAVVAQVLAEEAENRRGAAVTPAPERLGSRLAAEDPSPAVRSDKIEDRRRAR